MAAHFSGGDQTTSSFGQGPKPSDDHHHHHGGSGPNWLSSALLAASSGGGGGNNNNFLNLHSVVDDSVLSAISQPHDSAAELEIGDGEVSGSGGGGGERVTAAAEGGGGRAAVNWQNAKWKAEILTHPLYEQLLAAHVACLRIATPVDQLPRIDAQLAQSQNVVAKYSALANGQAMVGDDKELDQFMVIIPDKFRILRN